MVVGLEGTRSYGIGLARAVQAAGLVVVEVEHPKGSDRRRGKSDPIDARLAALHTLRLEADRLPMPRADGDREALRILLGARRELTTVRTRQFNRLRVLLLTGDDADRALARGTLTDARLTAISRRRGKTSETIEQAVRRAEARRLAIAIRGRPANRRCVRHTGSGTTSRAPERRTVCHAPAGWDTTRATTSGTTRRPTQSLQISPSEDQ